MRGWGGGEEKPYNPYGGGQASREAAGARSGQERAYNPYGASAPRGGKAGGDRFFGDQQGGKCAKGDAAAASGPPQGGAAAASGLAQGGWKGGSSGSGDGKGKGKGCKGPAVVAPPRGGDGRLRPPPDAKGQGGAAPRGGLLRPAADAGGQAGAAPRGGSAPAVRLNPADREEGMALMGITGTPAREKAKRKAGTNMQWVGVRANAGVVNSGRWAFCVWNESGGNLRVGWSAASASLKLGTDRYSFGYGGTATKSNAGKFEKYGQTFGQGDAITCCVDLDRSAILFFKNGREIPGDAFSLGKDMAGWPLFPHLYTKEATFSVSFDGGGGAPPLTGGFQWIASAGKCLVASKLQADSDAAVAEDAAEAGSGGSNFVLTSFGWRTAAEAKVPAASQEWRKALDAYVKHFTSLLELEYAAEREAVTERVRTKSPQQLQNDGNGVVGLSAEFDSDSGRITMWMSRGQLPYLSEISRGRTVLISTVHGGVDVDDATKTISGEVENIQNGTLTVVTSYERLPTGGSGSRRQPEFRADLGPNLVAYKRIDKMLDELQRSLGTAQAEKNARNSIERLNANHNLSGLLLPGTPFSSALYDDITESSQAAIKWDPLQRPKPNEQADISKASRERDIGASPYAPKGPPPPTSVTDRLNPSQKEAARYVLELRRRFSLIQGPPGTGKTTTAVATICGWLRSRRGPVLATAFSNRGVDNMAEALHKLGVRVLRVGLCRAEKPYSLETRLAECGERRGNKGMAAVLSRMDVVAATCIGVGMGPLDKHVFPYVVVDEAAQVIEPAVILPLGKGAVQAVMVGDQCQLPATVLSQEAQRRGLDVSMFDRLLSMGMEYQVLKEQYRMHPQIAAFPSWRFYRSELNSAVTASARQLPARLQLRSPLVFLHIDAMEQAGGASKKNPAEAACVSWLVEQVLRSMPATLTGEEIGVITPYGAQVREISRQLPPPVKNFIQVSTVDAFQGCEKQVILLSLVRANARGDVGFVADWRRLNVALTRSKVLCVLVGHLPTWLAADSGLLRDWLGFNPEAAANVLAFKGGAVGPLPPYLAKSVAELRSEHARMKPEATPLPRVTQEARGGSTGSSRAKLMMLDAARALAEALSGDDAEALSGALSQARQTGVDQVRIDEGETVLRRLVAASGLAMAVQTGEEATIRAAVSEARSVGVDEKKIREAEGALRQMAASQALEAAVATDDEAAVQKALAEAKGAGVKSAAVEKAETKLRGWEAARAARAAGWAGVRGAARELTAAISSRKEAQLQRALEKAREAGVTPSMIEDGEKVLKQVCAEGAAETELRAALGKRDEGSLQQAIAKAREAGARPVALKEAERVLGRLAAGRELADAIGSEDGALLEAAVPRAREAGVEAAIVERGAEALRRHSFRRALDAAAAAAGADPSLEEGLSQAIEAARAAGVAGAPLEAAELRLHSLAAARELYTARELVAALELAGSVHEEDIASLRAALAKAAASGADEIVLGAAQEVLARVQDQSQGPGGAAPAEDAPAEEAAGDGEGHAKRRRVGGLAGGEAAMTTLDDPAQALAMCALEFALLQCRKRRAIEDEDFDLAQQAKACGADVAARAAAARARCPGAPAPAGDATAELDAVRAEKRAAVEAEDFGRAAELKKREEDLLQVAGGGEAGGAAAAGAALALLGQLPPEQLLQACSPAVAACCAGAGPEIWERVAAELRSGPAS